MNDEALEVSVAAKGLRSTWQAGVLWRQLEPVKPEAAAEQPAVPAVRDQPKRAGAPRRARAGRPKAQAGPTQHAGGVSSVPRIIGPPEVNDASANADYASKAHNIEESPVEAEFDIMRSKPKKAGKPPRQGRGGYRHPRAPQGGSVETGPAVVGLSTENVDSGEATTSPGEPTAAAGVDVSDAYARGVIDGTVAAPRRIRAACRRYLAERADPAGHGVA